MSAILGSKVVGNQWKITTSSISRKYKFSAKINGKTVKIKTKAFKMTQYFTLSPTEEEEVLGGVGLKYNDPS